MNKVSETYEYKLYICKNELWKNTGEMKPYLGGSFSLFFGQQQNSDIKYC
jgi:N-acetylneuraminic acid mutarotase